MFLCRVRKSVKGQAFCTRYSSSSLSIVHKHNLCRVGRRFRNGCVRHKLRASFSSPAQKRLLLGDEGEE
jgi:hypothetical protein